MKTLCAIIPINIVTEDSTSENINIAIHKTNLQAFARNGITANSVVKILNIIFNHINIIINQTHLTIQSIVKYSQ
jgi:hypothetical protein